MINDVEYKEFVAGISSICSSDYQALINRMNRMSSEENVRVEVLLTAALGLSGEAGEFADHVKKLMFHDKVYDEKRRGEMILELGDIMWYVMQACIVLKVELSDVIQLNEEKLKSRHEVLSFKTT